MLGDANIPSRRLPSHEWWSREWSASGRQHTSDLYIQLKAIHKYNNFIISFINWITRLNVPHVFSFLIHFFIKVRDSSVFIPVVLFSRFVSSTLRLYTPFFASLIYYVWNETRFAMLNFFSFNCIYYTFILFSCCLFVCSFVCILHTFTHSEYS